MTDTTTETKAIERRFEEVVHRLTAWPVEANDLTARSTRLADLKPRVQRHLAEWQMRMDRMAARRNALLTELRDLSAEARELAHRADYPQSFFDSIPWDEWEQIVGPFRVSVQVGGK